MIVKLIVEIIILLIGLACLVSLVSLAVIAVAVLIIMAVLIIVIIRHCGTPPFYMLIFPQLRDIIQWDANEKIKFFFIF